MSLIDINTFRRWRAANSLVSVTDGYRGATGSLLTILYERRSVLLMVVLSTQAKQAIPIYSGLSEVLDNVSVSSLNSLSSVMTRIILSGRAKWYSL